MLAVTHSVMCLIPVYQEKKREIWTYIIYSYFSLQIWAPCKKNWKKEKTAEKRKIHMPINVGLFLHCFAEQYNNIEININWVSNQEFISITRGFTCHTLVDKVAECALFAPNRFFLHLALADDVFGTYMYLIVQLENKICSVFFQFKLNI